VRQSGLAILLVVALVIFVLVGITRQQAGESPVAAEDDRVIDAGKSEQAHASMRAVSGGFPVDAALVDECRSRRPPLDIDQYNAEREAHIREVAAALKDSGDAEHLAAAALLSGLDSGDVQVSLLARAAQQDPGSPLVAWTRLLVCMGSSGKNCEVEKAAANTIDIDGGNGAVWFELAVLRLRQGDAARAARAARRAVAAPRFDSYYIDTILLIERALSTFGDSAYADRIASGMRIAAVLSPDYGEFSIRCRQLDSSDGMWIELCDQIGARMFSESASLRDQVNGISLQKVAASRTEDERLVAAAAAREAEYNRHIQHLLDSADELALLENDETVFRRYVDNFATYGEMEAQVRLQAEAQRLRDSPDYDQCNFVPRGY